MTKPQIVWLRRDLRLADQPAFHAAAQAGPVIPVYIRDDETVGPRKLGAASRWWLHHSLAALAADLEKRGSRLILRRGGAAKALTRLAEESGAEQIHAIHHYEPWWRKAEAAVGERLLLHDGNYLLPPGELTTGQGRPYRMFTPFWRAALDRMPPSDPLDRPHLTAPDRWPVSDSLADWDLLPTAPDWTMGFADAWHPGEGGAQAALSTFADCVASYEHDRNFPAIEGTSRLSPHLHFGEVSPATAWAKLSERRGDGVASWRRELLWRDFAQNLIAQFPDYGDTSGNPRFAHFAWRYPAKDRAAARDFRAWTRGRTGYPIVDAGMRQLWHTGWMHNRVRMIAASFLVKHLLIDWTVGEQWFWDTLVDADYGNNSTNWQWIAGTGVDASLFPRIMAPLAQSDKFDAAAYIREWVPELAHLSDAEIHDPVARPPDYPDKIIDHRAARERALAAWQASKR